MSARQAGKQIAFYFNDAAQLRAGPIKEAMGR
jgi:hypothetical protein